MLIPLFIIFLFICFLVLFFKESYHINIPENIDASHFDNGDIIFFSGSTSSEKTIKFYTGCPFSHVSLLFKEDDIIYVWEADMGQGYKSGPRVMKLEDKFSRWKGDRISALKKWLGKRPSTKEILEVIGRHVKKDMDPNMVSWMFPKFSHLLREKNQVFCSELLAMSLIELGMIEKCNPTEVSPSDFFFDRVKCSGGVYGVPHFFNIDAVFV